LTDFLPAGPNVVSVTSADATCFITNNRVVCAVPVFPPQMELEVVIVVLPRLEGVFVNSVTLTAAEPETHPADNTASVATTVVSDASRALRINLVPNTRNAVVSWPTSAVPFTLQFRNGFSAADLWLPFTNAPAIVAGRNTVTNISVNGSRFFRLLQP